MKKIVFVFILPLIFGFSTLESSENISGPNDRTCCKKGSHNGETGEDLIYVSNTSCVTYNSALETLGSAHDRACEKAQQQARKAVAILATAQ